MSTSDEMEKLGREDPQPGMSRFDRAWEAANGIRAKEPEQRTRDLVFSGELVRRHAAIHAGDKVTGGMLLDAGLRIAALVRELEVADERIAKLSHELKIKAAFHTDSFRRMSR